MTRLFGFECEVARGVKDVLVRLTGDGLLPSPRLHMYHCECPTCDADLARSNPLHAQEDCTVEGEIITKPLMYGSDEADRTFAGLASALTAGRGEPGTGAGFHVHVSHEDMDDAEKVLLYRMFLRYQNDIAELASGQFGYVRDYNHPLTIREVFGDPRPVYSYCEGTDRFHRFTGEPYRRRANRPPCSNNPRFDAYDNHWYCGGHEVRPAPSIAPDFWNDSAAEIAPHMSWSDKGAWLALRDSTFEFRLWNSTRAEWRMRLAVGVSVAMVEAAKAGTNVTEHDERSLVGVLTPHLDSATLAGVLRQAHYIEEVSA